MVPKTAIELGVLLVKVAKVASDFQTVEEIAPRVPVETSLPIEAYKIPFTSNLRSKPVPSVGVPTAAAKVAPASFEINIPLFVANNLKNIFILLLKNNDFTLSFCY